MARMDDHERLQRFVFRARRVQAHSIIQNWEESLRHAQGNLDAHIDVTGQMTIIRRLPDDEEVFESLASKVRPFYVG